MRIPIVAECPRKEVPARNLAVTTHREGGSSEGVCYKMKGHGVKTVAQGGRACRMLGRWGTPEDIAAAVHWLVSPRAAFVTGQVININGGFRSA
jgi:NAD(P)-dependent dehydrogenase (short-subunit alcohol dehydrogenase family)